MKRLETLETIFLDTFRTELIIRNEETIDCFAKRQIESTAKEVKFINKLINDYNEIIIALDNINNKKVRLLALESLESLDLDIDFYIELLNTDFKALTKIVNKVA